MDGQTRASTDAGEESEENEVTDTQPTNFEQLTSITMIHNSDGSWLVIVPSSSDYEGFERNGCADPFECIEAIHGWLTVADDAAAPPHPEAAPQPTQEPKPTSRSSSPKTAARPAPLKQPGQQRRRK